MFPGALCRLAEVDTVAVTFDDGPTVSTEAILDALDAEDMLATFFLNGEAVRKYPVTARLIVERGHAIASHGFLHEDLSRKQRAVVDEDIGKSLAAIEDITGRRARYFRPPYGRLHPVHRDLPMVHGCRLVLWSAIPGDFDPEIGLEELRRRIDCVRGGDIVVLHDHSHATHRTTACIATLGDLMRRRGLRPVTL